MRNANTAFQIGLRTAEVSPRAERRLGGKQGKELEEAALAGASPKEKAYYAEFQRAIYEFRQAVAELLTAEQRERTGLTQGSDGRWRLRVK